MKSFNFPRLFNGNSIDIIEGKECVFKNLSLLFQSELYEFRYDPGYGSNVPLLLFRTDTQLTRDLLVDSIFDAQIFCPNVIFDRSQVVITKQEPGVYRVYIPTVIATNDVINDLVIYLEATN